MSKIKLNDHFEYGPTTVTYQQPSPECDILVNKQIRKTYGKKKNKVYLNDGDHIQLNLLNPLYHRIGVQLEFNGEKEEKMIILNPGQKVLLDRFIDTKKKIKFGTYFVDGSNDKVKESIKKNGNMKIHFWCEKMKPQTFDESSIIIDKSKTTQKWSPVLDKLGITDTEKREWLFNYNVNYDENYNLYGSQSCSTLDNTNGMGNLTNNLNSRIYTSSFDGQLPKLEETGRVEKGDKSKQKMKETEFEVDKVFHIKEFKLLPFSKLKEKKKKSTLDTKPKSVTVDAHSNYYRNTDHRIYCSNPLCGHRVRNQNWKFCPICSTEL